MAALNDIVESFEGVANSGFMTIQATAGQSWMIVNIGSSGTSELYKYNGTDLIFFDDITTVGGVFANFKFFINDTNYLRLKNTSGASANMTFDGVRFK